MSSFLYSSDYVAIENENGYSFGVYCGLRTGKTVLVDGHYAVITARSDHDDYERRRFLITFTVVQIGK